MLIPTKPLGGLRPAVQRRSGAANGRRRDVPFDAARIVAFGPKARVFGPPGSADLVLTCRNVHNWRSDGVAEAMFKGSFEMLKPGGMSVSSSTASKWTCRQTMSPPTSAKRR